MITHLEEDAENVLSYMASNGLIANASKTSFVNLKKKDKRDGLITVKIGNEIVTQVESANLLGVTFNEKQDWKNQIHGPKGILLDLNRRLKNHLNKQALLKVANGLKTCVTLAQIKKQTKEFVKSLPI